MTVRGKLEWDDAAGVAANARRELPRLTALYFADARKTVAGPRSPGALHRLRIASKKFRYTLELFRPVYPAGLDARLNELKKLQDFLGDVNDTAASRKLLGRRTLKRHPELREFLEKRAATQVAGFARYWKRSFDAKGREAWWTDFLATKARAPRRSPARPNPRSATQASPTSPEHS